MTCNVPAVPPSFEKQPIHLPEVPIRQSLIIMLVVMLTMVCFRRSRDLVLFISFNGQSYPPLAQPTYVGVGRIIKKCYSVAILHVVLLCQLLLAFLVKVSLCGYLAEHSGMSTCRPYRVYDFFWSVSWLRSSLV